MVPSILLEVKKEVFVGDSRLMSETPTSFLTLSEGICEVQLHSL
jgi:hypothetical protein